jgi:leucyl aminopeptidase
MNIIVSPGPTEAWKGEAVVASVPESEGELPPIIRRIDSLSGGRLKNLQQAGELTGRWLDMVLLHDLPGLAASRLLLVGVGKPEKFGLVEWRKVAAAAVRHLKSKGVSTIGFLLPPELPAADAAQAVTEGAMLGDYEPDKYKTDKKDAKKLASFTVIGFAPDQQTEVDTAVHLGRVIVEAQNFTRDLVNEPSNELTPRVLAQRALEMAQQFGLEAEILDERQIAEAGMGAFLSVARGSDELPRFIILRYSPPKPGPNTPVFGLVGKGITFDSGGLSIKPADAMEKMKYDMAGGATMLGVMRAIAQLKPPFRIMAFVPAAENLVSGRAQKPGDIQTSLSGKTIEVLNTDAEGRLVLADALTFAKRQGCTCLIDAATLTGAIVVALGNLNAGVFCSDDALLERFLASARLAGEKMWSMPLDDEYAELMKSHIADLKNVSGQRGAGAITAAIFLKAFTEDTPWLHLDIAGTAWLDEPKPWSARGASGIAVRALVHFLNHYPVGDARSGKTAE